MYLNKYVYSLMLPHSVMHSPSYWCQRLDNAGACFSLVSRCFCWLANSILVAGVQPWIPIPGSSYSCCHVAHLPHTTARVGGAEKVT